MRARRLGGCPGLGSANGDKRKGPRGKFARDAGVTRKRPQPGASDCRRMPQSGMTVKEARGEEGKRQKHRGSRDSSQKCRQRGVASGPRMKQGDESCKAGGSCLTLACAGLGLTERLLHGG